MSLSMRLLLCFAALVVALGLLWCLDVHCLIKAWFGLPCPLCGTVRGLSFLADGDPVSALYWHPLCWLTPILMAWRFLPPAGFSRRAGRNRFFRIAFLLLYLAVYGVRMFLLFPGAAPMELNPDAPILVWLMTGSWSL